MADKTITIPYEEYQELQSIRNVMSSDGNIVYVRDDTYSDCNHYVISSVHTKDDYVKRLTYKLDDCRKEIAKLNEQAEKDKEKVPSYWQTYALILGAGCITNILYTIFKTLL